MEGNTLSGRRSVFYKFSVDQFITAVDRTEDILQPTENTQNTLGKQEQKK